MFPTWRLNCFLKPAMEDEQNPTAAPRMRRLALSIVIVAALGFSQATEEKKAPAEETKAPAKKEYLGSEICQGCHEEIFRGLAKTPHGKVETSAKLGWKEKACESCHGPGSVHAETASPSDIRNPLTVHAREANAICLTCHQNQPTRVGAIRGGHARNQVACSNCHSVHAAKPKEPLKECGTCHVATLAQFQKPYRHRLQEGGVQCVDCHNPHGRQLSTNPLREVSANEPGCFRCHGDKRGPFAFEHAPVRMEGCGACHESHGSANPRMLTRADVRFQCLECHTGLGRGNALGGAPPAFHDLRNGRFQNCTVCHIKVHGSHVNRTLLR